MSVSSVGSTEALCRPSARRRLDQAIRIHLQHLHRCKLAQGKNSANGGERIGSVNGGGRQSFMEKGRKAMRLLLIPYRSNANSPDVPSSWPTTTILPAANDQTGDLQQSRILAHDEVRGSLICEAAAYVRTTPAIQGAI